MTPQMWWVFYDQDRKMTPYPEKRDDHSEVWVLWGCTWTSKLHRESHKGSTSGTGLMEEQFPGIESSSSYLKCISSYRPAELLWLTSQLSISSVPMYHEGKVVVCCHLQVSPPTNRKRSKRMAKLNWFVQAPVFQRGKIFYLWLSHPNLVDSMLAFYLIFSRSLHYKYKSRMHKQSTWHLQFILVTENLIDDKFRKWQIFNIGWNNLSLMILIILFFLALFLLAVLFQCSISCWVGKTKAHPICSLWIFTDQVAYHQVKN